jgi:DNA-binding MarR family transcriptional regulator
MKPSDDYLQFIHLWNAQTSSNRIEPVAQRLLEVIGIHHLSEQPLCVSELMNYSNIASPATLHRRMQSLQGLGFIELTPSKDGTRFKHVRLSREGLKYFKNLSSLIRRALKP